MDMSRYLQLFLSETREHLASIEEEIARLGPADGAADQLYELFRHAHSIKGMAASMGYPAVAELAHAIEDRIERARESHAPLSEEAKRLLGRAFDRIGRMLDRIGAGEPADTDHAPLVAALKEERRPDGGAAAGAAPSEPIIQDEEKAGLRVVIAFSRLSLLPAARAAVALKRLQAHGRIVRFAPSLGDLQQGAFDGTLRVLLATAEPAGRVRADLERLADVESIELVPIGESDLETGPLAPRLEPSPAPEVASHLAGLDGLPAPEIAPEVPGAPRPVSQTVRVPAQSLDRLLEAVAELIVERARLSRLLAGSAPREVQVGLERVSGVIDRLHRDVRALRMIPFESVAHRFVRSVRQLGESLGKDVELRISGRDVLLDRAVLEELVDPINHILRNAVDHGIEPPGERRSRAKPPAGIIEIALARTGDAVSIRVQDDGRGMDPAAIRRAALDRGLVTRESAEALSDADALLLTTRPGFSTAGRVTEVSGRGVGMDVVRTRIERLAGHLSIRSELGRGTTIEMRLPPAVVVVPVFLVEASGRKFCIPISSVRRTLAVGTPGRSGDEAPASAEADSVPLVDLAAALSLPPSPPSSAGRYALVAATDGPEVGVTVDRIVEKREVVIRPLGPPLDDAREFTGATVLEDGRVALILDLLNVARVP